MGTLIPTLPPPPPAPTPEMVDKWPSPCGQMYQRSWQRMNSLDLIFQRVPTKIRGCGCQSSLGKGGGGGGQVWIKNGTSHNKWYTSHVCERLPFVWKTRKFQGKFKWNGSSWWKLSGKKVIPFEVLPFSPSYRNDWNSLYHLFGLPVPGFMLRESEKFTGIL